MSRVQNHNFGNKFEKRDQYFVTFLVQWFFNVDLSSKEYETVLFFFFFIVFFVFLWLQKSITAFFSKNFFIFIFKDKQTNYHFLSKISSVVWENKPLILEWRLTCSSCIGWEKFGAFPRMFSKGTCFLSNFWKKRLKEEYNFDVHFGLTESCAGQHSLAPLPSWWMFTLSLTYLTCAYKHKFDYQLLHLVREVNMASLMKVQRMERNTPGLYT